MFHAMYIIIYLCVAAVPLAHSFLKIHHLMTPDEVMGIFHTTHDAVPYYELVPILYSMSIINESSTAKLRLKAFEQNIELRLNSTDGYLASEDTPVWTVTSNQELPDGLQYNLLPNALEGIGTPMHDEDLGAAILVKQRNHKLHIFDGILPSNFVIRSLPERIIKDILYGEDGPFKGHFAKNISVDDLIYTYHHIIYRKIPKEGYKNFDIINPLTRMYKIPDIVYPQVLIVVDYNLYKMLGKNVDQVKQYVVAFWNGVDLRYRVLTNPKIRLNIAGIIIAMDKDAVPYIENSLVNPTLVDADKILHGMGNYFYKENRFPWKIYDFVISNTKLNLCNKIDEELCDPATLGYAYVAGACNRNSTKKFSEAVGVAEDDGGFSGVLPTAHELGHLLGAHHDGTSKDAANCSAHNNNIMSDTLVLSANEFEWSNCSTNSFHKFLSEERAKCLYNEPPKATAIRRILPGKLMSPDDQCRKSYGGEACNKNSSTMCYELECVVPGTNGLCVPIAAAADGSSCGNGLICLDGACVLEGAEIMTEKMSM